MRVLDGAVVVLDAVGGVETQSETVWHQANKFGTSKLIFVNKMDRMGADFDQVLVDIKKRLKVTPLVVQYIVMKEEEIVSLIDLVEMKKIEWVDSLGNKVKVTDMTEDMDEYEEVYFRREELLENLSDFDEEILEKVIEGEEIGVDELKTSLRRALIDYPQDCAIVMCGR